LVVIAKDADAFTDVDSSGTMSLRSYASDTWPFACTAPSKRGERSNPEGERSNFEGERWNCEGERGKNSGAGATSAVSPGKT
jgi:hypothetical protein